MTNLPKALQPYILGCVTILVAILGTLFFVEAVTRLLDVIAPPAPRTWKEVALSSPPPPPYQNTGFDVSELTSERNNVNWTSNDDYGYRPKDTRGRYINIENGLRATTGSPSTPKNRVWVFGGSTIMGMEVPDSQTIPSQIQKTLNEKTPGIYQVVNLGATTLTTKHQLWRLINDAKDINTGDIVIFYDGVNDIIQSLYYKNPTGTMIDANRGEIAKGSILRKLIFSLYERFGEHSAFVHRFLYPFDPEKRNVEFPKALVEELKQNYFQNILAASNNAKKRGALFFHFIQPSLYSVNSLSNWEQSLVLNPWLYPVELHRVYATGYPALREVSNELEKNGVLSFDITEALNSRPQEIFLDYCHINHIGNAMVAQTIVQRLTN